MNKVQKKVQNIIVFTTEESKKFSLPYLSTRKEEIGGLVYSVATQAKTLLEDFNKAIHDLEHKKLNDAVEKNLMNLLQYQL